MHIQKVDTDWKSQWWKQKASFQNKSGIFGRPVSISKISKPKLNKKCTIKESLCTVLCRMCHITSFNDSSNFNQWSKPRPGIHSMVQEDKFNSDIAEEDDDNSANINTMFNHSRGYDVDMPYKPDFMEMDGANNHNIKSHWHLFVAHPKMYKTFVYTMDLVQSSEMMLQT